MFTLLYCIRDQHDFRLVALAGLICVISTTTAVLLLRQARSAPQAMRMRWLLTAGAATGSGIWATHFVAMLGYDPGVIAGYLLGLTAASLFVAVALTTAGFALAARSGTGRRDRRDRSWAAGAVVGSGIAAMHYIGMNAVQLPGTFHWAPWGVIVSVVFAILPTVPALRIALRRDGVGSVVAASALLALSILLLHFTGMAALTVLPDSIHPPSDVLLSPMSMGVTISAIAIAMLVLCLGAAILSRRAQAAIRASEREFRILVQGITDCALYMLDTEGRVANWNAGAERLSGYSAREAIGLPLAHFFSPEECAAGVPERNLARAFDEEKFSAAGWRYRKDGTRFWAHVAIEKVRDDRGEFRGFAKIIRDMTQYKEDQDRLAALTRNLDAALSNMHQGLCLFDADERLVLSNGRIAGMFGLSEGVCPPGTAFLDIVRVILSGQSDREADEAAVQAGYERHRACLAQPGGGTLVVDFSDECVMAVVHQPMPGGGWVSTFEDITERRRTEARIAHMALHDGLTGLANRNHFNDALDAELARAGATGLAVIAIDLDRFKEINDTHGHAAGDAVLKGISARMAADLREGAFVARLGGDEFAAFLRYEKPADLADFVETLERALTTIIPLDEMDVVPGGSIGIAVHPADGNTREQLCNNADLAMYRAKASIDRTTCYYEPGMDETARSRRILATDLRKALPRGELSVAYQVQRSVQTGDTTGYEALLRWEHAQQGWVSPTEFIPIAEENGEILRIGEWVLREACRQAASWDEPWKVAVNISPLQLMQVDLVAIVTQALLESGLPASRLELEITESAIIGDKLRALHVLRQIKALGVTVAIDDFGTGYSSLDTLNSFPFDKIKIDRSFLIDSDNSPQARAIIRAVLALGRSLDVPVLAEGLESEQQLKLLRAEGCTEAQGYLFGRPEMQGEESVRNARSA